MTTLAPNDFTHLHVHSEFSLLDGLGRITDLVDSAAAQNERAFNSALKKVAANSAAEKKPKKKRG